MKNKTAKQIVNAYRIKFALIVLLYVIALGALIYLMSINFLVAILGVIVLGVSVRAPFEKLREKEIESIIYEELDPEKYGEVLALGVLKKSARHQTLLQMSIGAHDDILKYVKESDKKTFHPIDRCNNLYREGYVYFERGEYDKLPGVVQRYEKLKAANPKVAYVLNNFTVFDKFDAFADDDYEYVVDVCDIDIAENNSKKQNHKLTYINVSFYRAVSLYKLGKFEEARAGFENIINYAPKMHKAKLSKDFIELIDKEK